MNINTVFQAIDLKVTVRTGKSNMVTGLAKSIRVYFQKQAFAIVGVKGRAKGTLLVEVELMLLVLLDFFVSSCNFETPDHCMHVTSSTLKTNDPARYQPHIQFVNFVLNT